MRRLLLLPLALAACSTPTMTDAPAMAPSASAALSSSGGVEHSVTGSGVQDIAPGFKYALDVSVRLDANGNVSGSIHNRILDLSLFGISGTADIHQEPTCMRVVGNTAYIGGRITRTSDPIGYPIGSTSVFWVIDGGPGGADMGHSGPSWAFDPDYLICTNTPPPLPAELVTQGNFVVR